MSKRRTLLLGFAIAIGLSVMAEPSFAVYPWGPRRPAQRAVMYNWHGWNANTSYGQPVALVVPPTAQLQTNYSWGVGASRVSRIDHQFGRNWPGPYAAGAGFARTPAWPADTYHFGTYYVRAPW